MARKLYYDFLNNPSLSGHDDATSTPGTPDLSITRATKATVVKSDGLIHEVSAGVARFTGATYSGDTASGTSTKGLLVEEARTNICLQSEDFGTTWSTTDLSVTTNATAAPDGSTTADLLTVLNVTDTFAPLSQTIIGIATSAKSTISCYVKAGTTDWVWLDVGVLGSQATQAYFDLTNGVVGATLGANVTATSITAAANGFYRCTVTFDGDAADIAGIFRIVPASGDGNTNVVQNDTIYVWGAQFETNAAFPTSYIATTTASVTRNAEDIKVEGASFGYSTDGGSAYVKATPNTVTHSSAQKWLFTLFADANNYLSALFTDANVLTRGRASGALDSAFDLLPLWAAGVESQLASGWSIDDIVGYFDGSAYSNQVTTGFPALPSGIDSIRIGSDFNGANQLNGHIAEIAYWDERLLDTQLSDLSDGTLAAGFSDSSLILRRNRIMKRRAKARRSGLTRIRRGRPMKY